MTPQRYATLVRKLTGIATKVLDAVPSSEAKTAKEICSTLYLQGMRADIHVVEGCLNSLKQDGLIKEPTQGHFIKVHMNKPSTVTKKIPIPGMDVTPPPNAEVPLVKTPTPEPGVKDTLSSANQLAVKLKAVHALLGGLQKTVAEVVSIVADLEEEVEDFGLQAEERIEKAERDTAKLKQLQALLKGIAE